MSETHWSMNSQFTTRFWQAAGEVGLRGKAALEALGVENIQDLPAEWGEVTAALQAAAAQPSPAPAPEPAPVEEQALVPEPAAKTEERNGCSEAERKQARAWLLEECGALPEAPAGAFTDIQTKAGFVWGVWVRSGLTPEMALESMKSVVEQIALFERAMVGRGWEPVISTNKVPVLPRTGPDQAPARQDPAPRQERPSGPVGGNGRGGDVPGYERVAVGKLKELTCRDGKFQVKVSTMKHALGWNLGTERLVEVFKDGGCWSDSFEPASLEGKCILSEEDFGALYVRYGKSLDRQHWDVIEIFVR